MDDDRRLTEELAEAGRDAVARGLTLASGGNLSARAAGRGYLRRDWDGYLPRPP